MVHVFHEPQLVTLHESCVIKMKMSNDLSSPLEIVPMGTQSTLVAKVFTVVRHAVLMFSFFIAKRRIGGDAAARCAHHLY